MIFLSLARIESEMPAVASLMPIISHFLLEELNGTEILLPEHNG